MNEERQELAGCAVRLSADGRAVEILDQTLLPNREEVLRLETEPDCLEAIRSLRVRGAPAIGIFAAYAAYVLALPDTGLGKELFRERFLERSARLARTRPTAVNLAWALGCMERVAGEHRDLEPAGLLPLLREEAERIHRDDIEKCTSISEYGLSLIRDGDGILTHCNAGPLATSRYGTALGPILLGTERGMRLKVFADETRPLLQGARLTAYELMRAGVDVTLICDSMASAVMKKGWVQAVFVGCDRVAANGDCANKIGTSGVAVLARYYGIPFYVLGPTSTVDMDCPDGASIPIELRDPEEIRSLHYAQPMAPAGVHCYNPAFDVTDHTLIAGIVTEKGICRPPYGESLKKLFRS